MEATHDHVIIQVVLGVVDGDITERATVCPQEVVRLGPHLPPQSGSATHLHIPGT